SIERVEGCATLAVGQSVSGEPPGGDIRDGDHPFCIQHQSNTPITIIARHRAVEYRPVQSAVPSSPSPARRSAVLHHSPSAAESVQKAHGFRLTRYVRGTTWTEEHS